MSPVGHTMVGVSIGTLVMPRRSGLRNWIIGLSAFTVLANLPDLPIRYWGHDEYYLSHSLFVNLAIIGLIGVFWFLLSPKICPWPRRFFLAGALVWLSHLVLDSFYNHGQGMAIFWPISSGRLNLAIPWFSTLDLHEGWWSRHNLIVMGIELLAYSPLLLLAIVGRVLINKKSEKVKV